MSFIFCKEDIDSISKVLGAEPHEHESSWSWSLANPETKQSLVFTIYNNIKVSSETKGTLISVQTQHGYFELHACTGFMVFEPDEVIFVQATKKLVSSLIIGRQSTCSMYANIDREILGADISDLDAPVLLSAMQLSLTEGLLP